MARLVKRRKKRRLRFDGLAKVLFTFAILSWLASSLVINTINNSLTISIQNLNNELAQLKNDNKNLNIEIQTLQNKDRVYVIAQDAGLNQNQDNIISIKGE